jgi:hypothetical protein
MMRALALATLVLLGGCARLTDRARGLLGPAQPAALVVPPGAIGGQAGIADDVGGTSGVAGGLIVETLKKTMAARP